MDGKENFSNEWIRVLIDKLGELRKKKVCSGNEIDQAIMESSKVCFKEKGFDKFLKNDVSFDSFVNDFKRKFGWEIMYDEPCGVIMVSFNNTDCQCPIAKNQASMGSALCCCSQGNIKKIFEIVMKKPLRVEVVSSIIRDGNPCTFKITLL